MRRDRQTIAWIKQDRERKMDVGNVLKRYI